MSPVACPNCQREVPERVSECPRCGPTASDGASEPPGNPTEARGYCSDAVAGFLLAIAALFIWPLAILAVVYGLAALRTFSEQKDRNQSVQKGRWMAVTAVAISVVFAPFVVYGVVFV